MIEAFMLAGAIALAFALCMGLFFWATGSLGCGPQIRGPRPPGG